MGRELKRKQAKKEGKNVKEINKEKEIEKITTSKAIKLFVVILLVIGCLYLFIGIVITKEIDWFNKKEQETITKKDNTILASNTLRQVEEVYYVYFYDFEDENTDIESAFTSKVHNYTIYRVNTNDSFNANYITLEDSNVMVDNISDLKVKSPTLIKVENEKIVEYYEDTDNILNYLNN